MNNKIKQLIQKALLNSNPKVSAEYYYRGLGLMKLGKEYFSEALYSFKRAIRLDKNKTFTQKSKRQITKIYKNLN